MHNSLKNERGMALAFMAVGLAMFIALVVVGVDLSRLAFTATEVQTMADIAATSGARTLFLGGDSTAVDTDALKAVHNGNTVDAANTNLITAAQVDLGYYDDTTGAFSTAIPNGRTANAVRADGHRVVTNFVAAALSAATTDVNKVAIAAIRGPAAGCGPPEGSNCASNDWQCFCQAGVPPCLPITASDCEFDELGQLPSLRVSNNTTDTAAWTAFGLEANATNVRDLLDPAGNDVCAGNGMVDGPGDQEVGDTLNLTNGINSSCTSTGQPWGLMGCIQDHGLGCRDTNNDGVVDDDGGTIFSIPIVHFDTCPDQYNQTQPMVGVAVVNITGACEDGNRQIDLQVINYTSSENPNPGGGCFGNNCSVRLVD